MSALHATSSIKVMITPVRTKPSRTVADAQSAFAKALLLESGTRKLFQAIPSLEESPWLLSQIESRYLVVARVDMLILLSKCSSCLNSQSIIELTECFGIRLLVSLEERAIRFK